MFVTRNVVTQQEVIAAIKKLAEKLERRPTLPEVCREMRVSAMRVRRLFGGVYSRAVNASGLAPSGWLSMVELFQDFVRVVRKMGRVPALYEYECESQYSVKPLRRRLGKWANVAPGMLQFGDSRQLWTGSEDIRELLQRYLEDIGWRSTEQKESPLTLREVDLDVLYAEPMHMDPMAMVPENELGVVFLFGVMARELGFVVIKLKAGFPDCEAFRRLPNGKWQRVKIEFEYQSKNFLLHKHDPSGCNMIVCWEHDWKECPLEVLELRKVLRGEPGA
jgi:hypothetical protein